MTDKAEPNTHVEEATVAIKGDVKTLQQLSSSGRAAQERRENNQAQKGFKALDDAVQERLRTETESQENAGK